MQLKWVISLLSHQRLEFCLSKRPIMKSVTALTGHSPKASVPLYLYWIPGFMLENYLFVVPWKFIARVCHDSKVIFKLPEMINLSGTRTQ